MKVLLASSSPRRKQLLTQLFNEFDVSSPEVDEDYVGKDDKDTVLTIAKRKLEVSIDIGYDVIIACDTMVFIDNQRIGKPLSKQHAFDILTMLNGKTHKVISGLAVWIKGKICLDTQTSEVTFNKLNRDQIACYIDSHDVMDKAGAYAIQDGIVVAKYDGEYQNIVGLPVDKLRKTLRENGIDCK